MSDSWQPVSALAQTVYALGFQYQPDQDIIVSRIDAWQRKRRASRGPTMFSHPRCK